MLERHREGRGGVKKFTKFADVLGEWCLPYFLLGHSPMGDLRPQPFLEEGREREGGEREAEAADCA